MALYCLHIICNNNKYIIHIHHGFLRKVILSYSNDHGEIGFLKLYCHFKPILRKINNNTD